MAHDGKPQDGEKSTAEHHIASFRATTNQAIGEWSDLQLNAVIARLREKRNESPETFALLMFLEDARLRRHELRASHFTDGKGPQADLTL